MAQIPIRIGIIGAGAIVRNKHLPGFAGIDDCKVVAVHNRRRANAEAVAREWNIPHVVDSPEAIYTRDDVNVVLVGTYPNLHRDLTLAALEHGKHVFCQARMARNLAEARDMAMAAKRHPDLVTQICIGPRMIEGEKFITELYKSGELGELRLVRCQVMEAQWLDPETPMHWRMSRELSGNQIQGMGIYAEELTRVYGKARTVTATGKVFTQQRRNAETGALETAEVPETVCITGELENGAHYVYNFSYVSAFGRGTWLEFYGTKAALFFDVTRNEIRIGKVGADAEPKVVPVPEPYRWRWNVEEMLASAIREGTPVVPDFEEGLRYMEFVEAVRLSLDGGRTVHLPLD